MKTAVLFFLLAFTTCTFCLSLPLPKVGEEADAFDKFMVVFNKNYSSGIEKEAKFAVFKRNVLKAKQMSFKAVGAKYGITKFMDLTAEEFKQFHTGFTRPHPSLKLEKYDGSAPVTSVPSAFDWRNKNAVTPVKNQGQCGSCWAFSTAEAIESAWFLAGNPLIKLSEQQIVSCDQTDDGCGGGDPPTAYEYVIKAGGIETEADYPYTATNGQCTFKKSDVAAHISDWHYITQNYNETEMKVKLYNQGPLSVCVDAVTWQFYTGGVIAWGDGCFDSLDHCVMITGYGQQESYQVWNVRNSWGTDWGENGYLYVERGYDLCGIADEVTVPTI